MLTSKILKNVSKGYPLRIEATKVEVKSVDYQPDFVIRMMKKVEYPALYEAAQTVSYFFRKLFSIEIKLKFFVCQAWSLEQPAESRGIQRRAADRQRRLVKKDTPGSAWSGGPRRKFDLPRDRPKIPDHQRHSKHARQRRRTLKIISCLLILLFLKCLINPCVVWK